MPSVVTNSFKAWLKANTNMKLSSDAAVTRNTYEGITTYASLEDFDTKSIERLPAICKESIPEIVVDVAAGIAAEPAILGANISSISVRRLIVTANAATYYTSIDRVMTPANMHHSNILAVFKIEWDAYQDLKKEETPKCPAINDRDNDRKVIKWALIFKDCLVRAYGSRGPIIYVLRDTSTVPTEADDLLSTDDATGAVDA